MSSPLSWSMLLPQPELSVSSSIAVPIGQWRHPSLQPGSLHDEIRNGWLRHVVVVWSSRTGALFSLALCVRLSRSLVHPILTLPYVSDFPSPVLPQHSSCSLGTLFYQLRTSHVPERRPLSKALDCRWSGGTISPDTFRVLSLAHTICSPIHS